MMEWYIYWAIGALAVFYALAIILWKDGRLLEPMHPADIFFVLMVSIVTPLGAFVVASIVLDMIDHGR